MATESLAHSSSQQIPVDPAGGLRPCLPLATLRKGPWVGEPRPHHPCTVPGSPCPLHSCPCFGGLASLHGEAWACSHLESGTRESTLQMSQGLWGTPVSLRPSGMAVTGCRALPVTFSP